MEIGLGDRPIEPASDDREDSERLRDFYCSGRLFHLENLTGPVIEKTYTTYPSRILSCSAPAETSTQLPLNVAR